MKIFVSYARGDLEGGELERFLDALDIELKGLTGNKASVLFRDLKDLRLGQEWKLELEDALKTSSLMLALCSPNFFLSDYCGREFTVFLDRKAQAGARFQAIIPIVWLPPFDETPEAVKSLQYDTSTLPKKYVPLGMRPMMAVPRHRGDGKEAILVLARSIAEALKSPLPAAATLPALDKTVSAFAKTGAAAAPAAPGDPPAPSGKANYARVFVAAGRRNELEAVRSIVGGYDAEGRSWRPFMPESDRTIMAEAQVAVGDENLGSEVLPIDDRLSEQIRQAERDNDIVLILVDPWTLLLPQYADRIRPFDQHYSANCALIVVWNKKDEETNARQAALDDALGNIFRNKMRFPPLGHVFSGVESRNELLAYLKRSITEAKLRVIQLTSEYRRAEAPALQQQAAQAGIDLIAPALLQNTAGRSR